MFLLAKVVVWRWLNCRFHLRPLCNRLFFQDSKQERIIWRNLDSVHENPQETLTIVTGPNRPCAVFGTLLSLCSSSCERKKKRSRKGGAFSKDFNSMSSSLVVPQSRPILFANGAAISRVGKQLSGPALESTNLHERLLNPDPASLLCGRQANLYRDYRSKL